MVCEVSRLSRSVKEFCRMLETIQQKHLRLMILGSITVDCREGQMDPMSTAFLSTTKDDIPAVFYKHFPAYQAGHMNVSEFARICWLSRTTVYKYLKLLE